ncbi:MAG: hypothetical protein ABSH49_28995 [Bryobacteraceae bacterium]|jgi:hypothetical protein
MSDRNTLLVRRGSFTTRKGNDVLWHFTRKFFCLGKKIVPESLLDVRVHK